MLNGPGYIQCGEEQKSAGLGGPLRGCQHFPVERCWTEDNDVCLKLARRSLQLLCNFRKALSESLSGTTHFPPAISTTALPTVKANSVAHLDDRYSRSIESIETHLPPE